VPPPTASTTTARSITSRPRGTPKVYAQDADGDWVYGEADVEVAAY
jgi:hypothetical protein